MYDERERPRPIFDAINIGAAVVAHLLLFGVFWLFGVIKPDVDDSDEEVIPIECLVVVNENLDGNEDEPPPVREVVPPPPEPEPPPPVPEPDPEPVVEPDPDPIVVEPIKPPDPPKPPKPPEVKKPDPPKPPEPPKETREQRLARMRETVKTFEKPKPVQTPPPRNNGRTEQRPTNWRELLNAGATPSNRNQGLDASEEQRCAGLIKKAFHEKWNPRPSWTPELRKMTLRVSFDKNGRVTGYDLVQRSGDVAADNSVLNAAKRVVRVYGLTDAYLQKHPTSLINFEVTPM